MIQTTWLIGDNFLQRIYHAYGSLRDQAKNSEDKKARESAPYMLDQYTISSHVMGEVNGIQSVAAHIQNCLIRQLNKCKSMPRFVVFIPDFDIIKKAQLTFTITVRRRCVMRFGIGW